MARLLHLSLATQLLCLGGLGCASEDGSTVNFPTAAGGLDIAPCAGSMEFCESADDYPARHQAQEIEREAVSVRFFKGVEDSPSLTTRIGQTLIQESAACDSRKSVVYPRKAQNTAGSYMFILNTKEYRQAVEVEQCIGEGQKCRTDEDAPHAGLTVCRQKYSVYKMLALDSQGKEILDTFSLPSACLCYYQDKPFGLRSAFEDFPVISICKPEDAPPVVSHSTSCSTQQQQQQQQQQRGGPVVFDFERKKRHHQYRAWQHANKKRDFPRAVSSPPLESPSGCDTSSTYCEATPCYPAQHALGQLGQESSSQLFDQLFRVPCTNQLDGIITRRFNINEQPLCEGVRRVIFPKQALNLRNEWKYVVNVGNYTQAVEVEECNPNRKSNSGGIDTTDGFSQSYGSCLYAGSQGSNPATTVCRQVYSRHKLLSLSGEGQLVLDTFRLPVACDCFIREDFQLEFKSAAQDGG